MKTIMILSIFLVLLFGCTAPKVADEQPMDSDDKNTVKEEIPEDPGIDDVFEEPDDVTPPPIPS